MKQWCAIEKYWYMIANKLTLSQKTMKWLTEIWDLKAFGSIEWNEMVDLRLMNNCLRNNYFDDA